MPRSPAKSLTSTTPGHWQAIRGDAQRAYPSAVIVQAGDLKTRHGGDSLSSPPGCLWPQRFSAQARNQASWNQRPNNWPP